jgi:hypothetical protein
MIISILPLVAVMVAAEGPRVAIESDSNCPAATAVQDVLSELVGSSAGPAASVSIRNGSGGVAVQLAGADGSAPQVRHLELGPDCDGRARAAAVVVAAWLGSLPATALSAPTPARKLPPATNAYKDPSAFSLGLGASVDRDGQWVPSVALEGTLALSDWFAAGLGLSVGTPRQVALGPGQSHFLRPVVTLAGRFSLPVGEAHLSLDLGLASTLTWAWGTGYAGNDQQHGFDWGGMAGLRLAFGRGKLRPWLGVRSVVWAQPQRLRYDDLPSGAVTSQTISPVEVLLAAGCQWAFR